LKSNGRGTYSTPQVIFESGNPSSINSVDWDADGDLDIAFVHGGSNSLIVLRNDMRPPASKDCNFNHRPDECDIAAGWSRDEDGNGVPDECFRALKPPQFHRGDADGDGSMSAADAIHLLTFLFREGRVPDCLEAADANNDGDLELSDGIFILRYLFDGGRSPPSPGPPAAPCGRDADVRGSAADLGCDLYAGC
jgi:hypothetical protein